MRKRRQQRAGKIALSLKYNSLVPGSLWPGLPVLSLYTYAKSYEIQNLSSTASDNGNSYNLRTFTNYIPPTHVITASLYYPKRQNTATSQVHF